MNNLFIDCCVISTTQHGFRKYYSTGMQYKDVSDLLSTSTLMICLHVVYMSKCYCRVMDSLYLYIKLRLLRRYYNYEEDIV